MNKYDVLEGKTVTTLGELKLVGLRVLSPDNQYKVEIPKAVRELDERVNEIKHVVNPSVQIGAFVVETEKGEEDGYWVCVEVGEYENIPKGMETLSIPSQKYAIWNYKGANTGIMGAYEQLHTWISENSYTRLTEKWHLEVFYNREEPGNMDVMLLDTVK